MAILDRFQPGKHMLALLEYEHRAIVEMNFDALQKLAPRKEKALAALARAQVLQSELDAIRAQSTRNQNLLEAASKGIHVVRTRLAETRKSAADFSTYDRSGSSTPLVRKPLTKK